MVLPSGHRRCRKNRNLAGLRRPARFGENQVGAPVDASYSLCYHNQSFRLGISRTFVIFTSKK
jgi:hypothetical protein